MRQVGGKWVARLCKASCNLLSFLWLQWYLLIVLRIPFIATKTARPLSKNSFWEMQYLSQYIWKWPNYQRPHHHHQVFVNSPNFSQSPRFPPRSVQDDVRRWKKINVRLRSKYKVISAVWGPWLWTSSLKVSQTTLLAQWPTSWLWTHQDVINQENW